ncbi:hypothetical protein Pcinc_031285 [Petrolisthes cinctipes]|uniref:Uncharacterized protein n=1 Tax=Petrolisthes cinctipes TaxID=88211 RepID=A0AAE1EWM7_PETCI|nr:hypothetical protein Pcinc_031285 [Petrolisthes cinctipes]
MHFNQVHQSTQGIQRESIVFPATPVTITNLRKPKPVVGNMDQKVACICILVALSVLMGVRGVPVAIIDATDLLMQTPQERNKVLLVKREAKGGIPCGFSAVRCSEPDTPALCRHYRIPVCPEIDFIDVNI